MADLIKHIKAVYRHKDDPFDELWRWARSGKSKRERYRRFRALQKWAQGNRANNHGNDREKWNARRKVYAKQKRKILARINDSPTHAGEGLGTGPWAGSQSLIDDVVLPVYAAHGIPVTSTKRWATYGNPSSDHYMGNTTAYAADGGVANAYWLHAKIADAFRRAGCPLSATPSEYASVYCTTPNGNRYRYQGIAQTHGTGPHHHAGVRRA